jgi:hypothetical protein
MANAVQISNAPLPQPAPNTTLTGSIASSGGGTVTVASAANLPAKGPFLIVVDNERIEVDSISGTTLTYLSGGRAQEGTSAAAHSSGASVYQVLSAATLVRLVDDRTATIMAPDPTGTAATDTANINALTSTANRVIQLRPGTYVINALNAFSSGVVLRGWRRRQTTLQLAVQGAAPSSVLTLGTGGGLEYLIMDGNRANQTWAGDQYSYGISLADGAFVRKCLLQNFKTSVMGVFGGQHVEIPQLTTLTTSTSGGSLATGVQHWYRVTATTASGETPPSQELSVTTGAGATNSNTLRWRRVTGATGYKVYHATTAGGQWNELLLATIGSGSTVVYVHTTGSGATTSPPLTNTSGGAGVNKLLIEDNDITTSFGRGVYLEGNINKSRIIGNRLTALGDRGIRFSGAPIGQYGYCIDNIIDGNQVDHSAMSVLDSGTCGIEVWNRCFHTVIVNNEVIGPADNAVSVGYLGISVGGNCDETIVDSNIVRKSNPNGSNQAIYIGIENAGNSGVVISNNNIRGCNYGITVGSVDFSSGGVDNCSVIGNRVVECWENGIQISEGSGHTIQGNTWVDCGWRYINLNGFAKQTLANAIIGNTCVVASMDRSAVNGGRLDAIFVVDSGRQTIEGNICGPQPPIATPPQPTITPQGTTGAATYSYRVTAINEYGETVGSTVGTTTSGNATLSVTNFNRITFTRVYAASGYRVYRTAGTGGAGYIGFTAEAYGQTPTFDDTGIAADTNITAPATGTTGGTSTVGLTGLYFQGTTLVEASVISGNRWDGSAPVGAAQPAYAIVFDGAVDYTQVVNNFAQNYSTGFLQQTGTPGANPNFIQFNLAPGIPLPHVVGSKFSDVVRRSEEVQRAGGGLYLADDFVGGLLTTGDIGALGWQFVNGTAPTTQAAVAGRPGILRMDTSATSGTRQYLWVGSSATVGQILPADYFHIIMMVRMTQTDANTVFRMGLGNSANADPPADGIFIEKLLADTQWFGVTRSASSQTRTSQLGTVSAGTWIKARFRRISATQIGFTISTSFAPDNGTEGVLTATIPTTALVPFLMIGNSAAASKTADIDYFEINVQNMNR